jgi:hypothetical protein
LGAVFGQLPGEGVQLRHDRQEQRTLGQEIVRRQSYRKRTPRSIPRRARSCHELHELTRRQKLNSCKLVKFVAEKTVNENGAPDAELRYKP